MTASLREGETLPVDRDVLTMWVTVGAAAGKQAVNSEEEMG